MKRLMQGLGLLLAGLLITLVWISTRSAAPNAIRATYLFHTNLARGHGLALLEITNQTPDDYAVDVNVQHLAATGWRDIRYNLGTASGPNSSYSGSLRGHSNVLIQVAAPEKNERFWLRYQRVPSKGENYISWTLSWFRAGRLFAPKPKTEFVYPEAK